MTTTPATHRARLPQLDGGLFLTDAGLETELVFHDGIDLPQFAAYPLLADPAGRERLARYYRTFARMARDRGTGLVLESPTWRASAHWGRALGHDAAQLDALNRDAIALLREVRDETGPWSAPVVVSGCVGPQDDAYRPGAWPTVESARRYHAPQVASLAAAGADLVTAITMTSAAEAAGVALAAADAGVPAALSFTVETDGRLPDGQALGDAIAAVDAAADVAYVMVNCAHPVHLAGALAPGAAWTERVLGLRANASTLSHAELDEATELDDGDPHDLAERYVALRAALPRLTVLGGCCGTDARHVERIADAWLAAA